MAEFVTVAKVGELEPGRGKTVTVNDVPVALFNADGKYYAIHDTCCHRGGPLGEGTLDGLAVSCPWHGWEFDVTTGQCLTNPDGKVPCFEVRMQGDEIQVAAG
jgi:NAD(P)H-dependent nitrite reductase small subunit